MFIRFSRCNLWADPLEKSKVCPFCDTPQLHNATEMTAEQILHDLQALRSTDVVSRGYNHCGLVISGGEPLLQLDHDLLRRLAPLFPWIDVETNGTVTPKFSLMHEGFQNVFISCSPKTKIIPDWADWYKLLIPDKEHLLQNVLDVVASRMLESLSFRPRVPTRIYLQAVEAGGIDSPQTKQSIDRAVALCLRHGIPLSFQSHKLLGLK